MQALVILSAEFEAMISVFLWTKIDGQWDGSNISRTVTYKFLLYTFRNLNETQLKLSKKEQ